MTMLEKVLIFIIRLVSGLIIFITLVAKKLMDGLNMKEINAFFNYNSYFNIEIDKEISTFKIMTILNSEAKLIITVMIILIAFTVIWNEFRKYKGE